MGALYLLEPQSDRSAPKLCYNAVRLVLYCHVVQSAVSAVTTTVLWLLWAETPCVQITKTMWVHNWADLVY